MPDLREIIKQEAPEISLPKNHRAKFQGKLKQLHKAPKRKNYTFLMIAASIVVLIGLSYTFWPTADTVSPIEPAQQFDIANVSPELKQIETNYVTAINLELLGLKMNSSNKELIDKYLKKVADLEKQYQLLSKDLITKEDVDETVNALINNLQVRLQLLVELKDNLKEIEQNKEFDNENISA